MIHMTIDPERRSRNRQTLAAHNLDAVICRLPENVLLLAGFWPISSAAFVVFTDEGESWLIAVESRIEVVPEGAADHVLWYPVGPDVLQSAGRLLSEVAREAKLGRGRIGLELGFESVATGHTGGEVFVPAAATRAAVEGALPAATFVDAAPALEQSRRRKTAYEIKRLRDANEIAGFGLQAFCETYEPGRSEAEVAAAVEAAIMARGIGHAGARHVRGWAQLMTGPPSAHAHSTHPATSARRIERGDLGVLELGTVVDGFWSDLTRTLVAGGSATEQQATMYRAVTDAVDAAVRGAHAGMTGGEVDALARTVINDRGYGDLFVHPTGHGLGFRYHESAPSLRPRSQDPVEVGAVTSIEPGLYREDFGGMRLEENVVYAEDGVEVLSTSSTELGA
jgi:Xaa-Pro aminopeptidase